MSSTDPFSLVGRVLDGQYRVEAFVGQGGFSAVYKGTQEGLDEPCAIKCLKLPPGLAGDLVETFVRRFRDESKLHYRLAQGNLDIARSLAAGSFAHAESGHVVPYIVLEWLEGRTLAQELTVRRSVGQTGMAVDEALRLLDSAAKALAFAHQQGVVHRDVTPGNLFVLRGVHPQRLKVLDFGLAKVMSDHALALGPRAPTMGFLKLFSPAYAAPEQFDESLGAVGPWTDVYAFAQIAVECLRDAPAVDGESLADYAMAATNRGTRPTPGRFGVELPAAMEAVFARALQVDPRERFADLGAFWAALTESKTRSQAAAAPQFADDDERTHVSSVDEMRGLMEGLENIPLPGTGPRQQVSPLASTLGRSPGARTLPPRPSQAGQQKTAAMVARVPRPASSASGQRPAVAVASPEPSRGAVSQPTGSGAFRGTAKHFPAPQGALPAAPSWQSRQGPPAHDDAEEDPDEATIIRASDEDFLAALPPPPAAGRPPAAVSPYEPTSVPSERHAGAEGAPGSRQAHPFASTFAMANPAQNQAFAGGPAGMGAQASGQYPASAQLGGGVGPGSAQQPAPASFAGPGNPQPYGGGHPQHPGMPPQGSGHFAAAQPAFQSGVSGPGQFHPPGPGAQGFAPAMRPGQGYPGTGMPGEPPFVPGQHDPGAAPFLPPGGPTLAAPRSRAPLAIAAVVSLAVLGVAAFFGVRYWVARQAAAEQLRAAEEAVASAQAASPPVVPPPPVVDPPPAEPPAVDPPPAEPPPAEEPPPVSPPVEPPPAKEPPQTTPKEEPAKVDPPKPVAVPGAFNANAARSSLGEKASLASAICSRRAGPGGSGAATIAFSANGTVASVVVQAPHAGTEQGKCVAGYLQSAKIPSFTSGGKSVLQRFVLK